MSCKKKRLFLPIVHQSENFQRFHVFEISSFVIYSFFFLFCGLCKLTEFFLETKFFWTKKLLWNFKYYIIGNFCIPKKNGLCTNVTTYYYYLLLLQWQKHSPTCFGSAIKISNTFSFRAYLIMREINLCIHLCSMKTSPYKRICAYPNLAGLGFRNCTYIISFLRDVCFEFSPFVYLPSFSCLFKVSQALKTSWLVMMSRENLPKNAHNWA